MDKRMKSFSNTLNALRHKVNNSMADDPAESASPGGYRPPEIIRLGSAVSLIKQSSTGTLIDGNEGWWVYGS